MATKEEILSIFTSKEGAWFSYNEGIRCGYYEAFNSLRNQAAIAAMQAQISDHEAMTRAVSELINRGDTEASGLQKVVAERSVSFADALIEELKNKEG